MSIADIENGISEYAVNHRSGRGSGRQIPVSVANSPNCISGYAANYRTGRHPWRRFLDSVVRFLNGPRLSPGKGAKVVPKVPHFAGRPVARSPRSRAPAPQVVESSIVLSFLGGGGWGYDFDGKTRHFGDIGRRFFDSVTNSKNGISGYAVNYRPERHP